MYAHRYILSLKNKLCNKKDLHFIHHWIKCRSFTYLVSLTLTLSVGSSYPTGIQSHHLSLEDYSFPIVTGVFFGHFIIFLSYNGYIIDYSFEFPIFCKQRLKALRVIRFSPLLFSPLFPPHVGCPCHRKASVRHLFL